MFCVSIFTNCKSPKKYYSKSNIKSHGARLVDCTNFDFETLEKVYEMGISHRETVFSLDWDEDKEVLNNLQINLSDKLNNINQSGIYNFAYGVEEGQLNLSNSSLTGGEMLFAQDTIINHLRYAYVLSNMYFGNIYETRFGILIFPKEFNYYKNFDCGGICDLSISLYFPLSECLCNWDAIHNNSKIIEVLRKGYNIEGNNNHILDYCSELL